MKVYVFSCVLLLVLSCSSHADAEIRNAPPLPSGGVGVVSEDMHYDDHEFDQEVLAESLGGRKKFHDLSPSEIVAEIQKLVSRADKNGDSKLNKQELVAWLKRSEDLSYKEEAASLFEKEDANRDGFISFDEFWQMSEVETLPPEEEMEGAQAEVKTRFRSADTNGDGKLNAEEFVPFVHPFRHAHMVDHLLEDQLVMYDKNQDGLISLEEYVETLGGELYHEEGAQHQEEGQDWAEDQRIEFEERLDKDKDGALDHQEIKDWVAPDEVTFFEQEAEHLLTHADLNEDGALTVEEIEGKLDIFIESPLTDYGHSVHDEL